MRLTAEMLEQAGACQDQLDLFRERFPEGCKPTAELCKQFPDFDYSWAARKLLSPEKLAAYRAARDKHWAAYQAAVAPHLAAYEAARAETFGRMWEEP